MRSLTFWLETEESQEDWKEATDISGDWDPEAGEESHRGHLESITLLLLADFNADEVLKVAGDKLVELAGGRKRAQAAAVSMKIDCRKRLHEGGEKANQNPQPILNRVAETLGRAYGNEVQIIGNRYAHTLLLCILTFSELTRRPEFLGRKGASDR